VTSARARRWLWRSLQIAGAAVALVFAVVGIQGCTAFGHRAQGARRARIERSPQWLDGSFRNPQPLVNDGWLAMKGAWSASPDGRPRETPPVSHGPPGGFATLPGSGLRATWLGHSSTLIEIDGHRVLTDPVWSERASPLPWVGPGRWYAPPVPLAELPPIDAVVISHDHYDHLDLGTVRALAARDARTVFIVPLGIGAHLAYWGVAEARIVELDWWQQTRLRDLTVVCTPARHASGRMLVDNDSKLWAGWALLGHDHRVYFSGDTGLFPAMRDIGERLGPFDLTMIEIGEYNRAWPDWHSGPEQAVRAHGLVRGRVMLPVHWGLFRLAYHTWTEPIERALAAGRRAGATLVSPRPGQSFEPESPPPPARWWPRLSGHTAEQDPIVSSQVTLAP
jgi:L-ascorbate metabolism protein UlaG (beta-lactamase superfamily)